MNNANSLSSGVFNRYEKVNLIASSFLGACALFLLLLNTTRSLFAIGLMPFLSLPNAQFVYFFSSTLVMAFSIYGLYFQHKLIYPNRIRKLFYLNLLIYIAWLVPEIIVGKSNVTHFISLGLVPFSIFIFMQIPSEKFKRLILSILFIASIVTIYDFLLANNPLTNEFRENLRLYIDPGVLAQTRVGIFVRAVGVTGNEHDTACMLVILNTFLLAMKQDGMNKVVRIFLLYITYIALIMTLSLANIIAMFVITIFFFFYNLKRKEFLNPTFIGIPFLILILSIAQVGSNLGNTTSGENLGPGNLVEALVYKSTAEGVMDIFLMSDFEVDYMEEISGIFLGHDMNSDSSWGKKLEFAIFRLAYLSGIIGYLITLSILFFPLYLYLNSDKFTKSQMLPYLMPLLAGILTLWHYGSLIRPPNIFLFFAIYGICIRQYLLALSLRDYIKN
jgi:hypothetical protein